jgi:phage shock protein A
MNPTHLVDVLLVVLLVATLVYAVILSRRLTGLRSQQGELRETAHTLDKAAERAEASLRLFKSDAEAKGQGLDEAVKKATALRQELRYLVERGNAIAARLERAALGATRAGDDRLAPSTAGERVSAERARSELAQALERVR